MKFRVERDVLAEAVTWAARGLPSRPPVPVLAGILIEAEEQGKLTLSAFDYEVSARITVAADVAEGGTVLVHGKLLADISRNLPGKSVDVGTDGNKVTVTCGSSRFSLLQMPSDEYPTLPVSPEPSGSIAGDVFTQAVAQVSVAADRSDTLPILTGVRLEIDGSTMTMLATDRYRLALRELTWDPSTDSEAVMGYYGWRNGKRMVAVSDPEYVRYRWLRLKLPLEQYTFAVSAFDAAGNESAPCPPVTCLP